MDSYELKTLLVDRLLPSVQAPAQYIGGEWNSVRKDHAAVRGTLCLAFPDTYAIGMSCYGLQVLYELMNARDDWACERVFAPWSDMEPLLREHRIPLYSLETFTPLGQFDVLGFSLQYEMGITNVLNMLDLAGIPLRAERRTMRDPLVLAGGPCVYNPEPAADFFDAFVIGDGELALPAVCDLWMDLKEACRDWDSPEARAEALAVLGTRFSYCYIPRFYQPRYGADGRFEAFEPLRNDLPERIEPAVVDDLESIPPPVRPIVPYVETVHDRLAIEIMRGCPGMCRFCQSTILKHPLRRRSIESIVSAALQAYRNTGHDEISLLSLSSGDYPQFEQLVGRMKEVFQPLGVAMAIPSLRINQQLRVMAELIGNERRSALTLAPEVARDAMRRRICKRIQNDDLYEGCREAFRRQFQSVKLYFMCGLPGEGPEDLDGIIEMAERISFIGKEERGRLAAVTASVSNFIPKPHTPLQWDAMQRSDYFAEARRRFFQRKRLGTVSIKCHDVETSLLEGVLCRGDRRLGEAIKLVWQRGGRLDAWSEHLKVSRWHEAFHDAGIDVDAILHEERPTDRPLPWDHIGAPRDREFLLRQCLHSREEDKESGEEPRL